MSTETLDPRFKVGIRAKVALVVAVVIGLVAAVAGAAVAGNSDPIPVYKTLTASNGSTVSITGTVDFTEQGIVYDLTVSPTSSGLLRIEVAGNPPSLHYVVPAINGRLKSNVGQGYLPNRPSADIQITSYSTPNNVLYR